MPVPRPSADDLLEAQARVLARRPWVTRATADRLRVGLVVQALRVREVARAHVDALPHGLKLGSELHVSLGSLEACGLKLFWRQKA